MLALSRAMGAEAHRNQRRDKESAEFNEMSLSSAGEMPTHFMMPGPHMVSVRTRELSLSRGKLRARNMRVPPG